MEYKRRENKESEIFLSKLLNKYSGNAEKKHLNQMYDIGLIISNKKFDEEKMVEKLTKIIKERTDHPVSEVKEEKRKVLINALIRGIEDGLSTEYREAYDDGQCYRYENNREKLSKRGYIDSFLKKI
jgi:hypothetical protein